MTPKVSVGIPLYRSLPFIDTLRSNLAALAEEATELEVIVTDRHGHDDAISILEAEFGGDPRFTFASTHDELNWVQHANELIQIARGDYFRLMPHDDVFPAGCLQPLIQRLDEDAGAVLAYAPTRAVDHAGERIPHRDRVDTSPVLPGEQWELHHSTSLFWLGSCDGAFKGLFRRAPVLESGFPIAETLDLVHAERAWLFGVSLLGSLAEEPSSLYFKRFHDGSTHAQWKPTRRHLLSTTAVMTSYLVRSGRSAHEKARGTSQLWRHALPRLTK